MATGRFTSDLEYKLEDLRCLPEVVQKGIIHQNSLSHLNLEASSSRIMKIVLSDCPQYFDNEEINIEENLISSERKLLYNLHLDLPREIEWNLMNESLPKHLKKLPHLPCLATQIDDYLCIDIISNFILHTYTHPLSIDTYRREKVLKWFVKLGELKRHGTFYMPPNVLSQIVDFMHVEYTDSEFVKKCLERFRFLDMLMFNDKPERVEKLLYVVTRQGNRLDREYWMCKFSDLCLRHTSFEYVDEVFKFLDAPHLCEGFMDRFRSQIRTFWRFGREELSNYKKKDRRYALHLHLYWTNQKKSSNPSGAAESLRLVWNAVPDPFISYHEIVVNDWIRSTEIPEVYNFYSKAIGEYHKFSQPRPMKHLCRSTIRHMLWKSNQWLPEGIEQLDLPITLKSYLKLEK